MNDIDEMPLVTFGIVNCNRLHYFKSCLESLLFCTQDYKNKEIIVVDNASVEPGTDEYLNELRSRGIHVYKTSNRDPNNEYARALNYIVKNAQGDYVCPLAGDMQFIVQGGWLYEFIKFYEQNPLTVGCISFDAQRRITNRSHQYGPIVSTGKYRFIYDESRPPIATSANCLFSKENLELMGPWEVDNLAHEGGNDSENKMWRKVMELKHFKKIEWTQVLPIVPVSIAIWNDPRGTNARVRDNKRYGEYWAPKKDFRYYEIYKFDEITHMDNDKNMFPLEVERLAQGIGWRVPIDASGAWKKNPIDPVSAMPGDYTVIDLPDDGHEIIHESLKADEQYDYLSEWLDEN